MSHHHRTLIDSSSSSSSTASAIGSLPSLSTLLRNSQTCHNNNPIDNNSNIIKDANSSCSSISGNNGFADGISHHSNDINEYHQNSDIKISSTSSTQPTQQQKMIPVTEHCHFIGQHASLFVEFCRNNKFHDDGPGTIADGDKKNVKLEQFSWTTSSPTTATSTVSNDIPPNSEQQLVEMVNKTYDVLNILNKVKHYLQKPIISKRAAPPGRCHSCNISETPEWRRGPDGARTLCNACGLLTNHHIYVDNNNNNIQYHSPPIPPHQLPRPHSLSPPPPHSYM
nr:1466_t:CDS:2 [Entrophospora candida]